MRRVLALASCVLLACSSPALAQNKRQKGGDAKSHMRVRQGAKPAAAAQVELLSPGAEPRAELRLSFTQSDERVVDMTMRIDMTAESGGKVVPMPQVPGMRLSMKTVVARVADDGAAHVEFSIPEAKALREAGAGRRAVQGVQQGLDTLKGSGGVMVVSPRGEVRSIEARGAGELMETMTGSLSKMAIPLPAEPVGVGARWRVTATESAQGIGVRTVHDYEVLSIEGSLVRCKATYTQSADRAGAHGARGGPTVTALTGSGDGEVVFDLTSVLPRSAEIRGETDVSLRVADGKETIALDQHVSLNVTLKQRAGAPEKGPTASAEPKHGADR